MALSPTPTVLVVIVNYRTPQLTRQCLESLVPERAALPALKVTVVDNASGDDSLIQLQTAIAKEGWDWVEIIASDYNGGYAYGNNLAIRPALAQTPPPDYIWLLNPDTVIHPGALESLVAFMETHPTVGIAGSRLESPDGSPQCSAFRFPTLWSEVDSGLKFGPVTKLLARWMIAPPVVDDPQATDWVSGASFLIRREVFDTVGLMDEQYFLYFEEVDFCLQAQRRGWSCWYVPTSRVVHWVGQSSGVMTPGAELKRLPQYWFDSRRRFFTHNYSPLYGALADGVRWGCGLIWQGRRRLQGKPDKDPPYFLPDLFRNSFAGRWLGVNPDPFRPTLPPNSPQ